MNATLSLRNLLNVPTLRILCRRHRVTVTTVTVTTVTAIS